MAMTKAEKAEMERLQYELSLARALRWSDRPMPERVKITQSMSSKEVVQGWNFSSGRIINGSMRDAVFEAWTTRMSHGHGVHVADNLRLASSRQCCPVFATRLNALVALRLEVQQECAGKLALIDNHIMEEETEA